jgi:hypothetical protein
MEGYIVFVVALAALIITHRILVLGAKKFEEA